MHRKSFVYFSPGFAAIVSQLSLLFFLSSALLPAQELKYADRGNRMEGTKEVPSSSLDLRLVSFTGYRENFGSRLPETLTIKFYVRQEGSVFIAASEVIPVRHYFMDPSNTKWGQGWQVFAPWPTSKVLKPLGILPQDLGLVARVGSPLEGSGEICPVILYGSAPPEGITGYSVVLISRETIRELEYTLTRVNPNKTIATNTLRKEFPAGVPILVNLNVQKEQAGMMTLSVKCRIKGQTDGPKRTFQFNHQPKVPN